MDEPPEPQLTREERIAMRKKRVEDRKNAANTVKVEKVEEIKPEQLTTGYQQLADSLAALDNCKERTIDNVTSIRVTAEDTETKRRITEADHRQQRLVALEEEAYKSGQANAVIDMKWSELGEYETPMALKKAIEQQKADCDAVIASKEKLITDFTNELKAKDEEYVKALSQFSRDIRNLLLNMKNQYIELQREYEVEFARIEDAFLAEREERLKKNKEELDGLFKARKDSELKYLEDRQNRTKAFMKEMDDIRRQDDEAYTQLKIDLENKIQELEQQLEEMRSTYQLNTEKLEYNYRVLNEREMENTATLLQQKKKESKLKETLNSLIQKYNETDKKLKAENQKLSDEFLQMTKAYNDLQKKTKHFLSSDNQIYQQVWAMHHENICKTMDKAMKAYSVVSEQQMGLKWESPSMETLLDGLVENPEEFEKQQQLLLQQQEDGKETEEERDNRIRTAKVEYVFSLLYKECPFLIEQSVIEEIQSFKSEDQNYLLNAMMRKSLNINNKEDEELLVSFFFDSETAATELEDDKEEESIDMEKLGFNVPLDKLVEVTKKFLETKAKKDKAAGSVKHGMTTALNQLVQKKEELILWERFRDILPPKVNRVWIAMEKALEKYNGILADRAKLADEVAALTQQNQELKQLLQQYLISPVNEQLIIPPSQYLMS